MKFSRRNQPAGGRKLAALLNEPGTVHAAAAALAMAGGDPDWWPYAAVVGADAVMVRLAGLRIPDPAAPWRAAGDPRVWAADRGAVEGTAPPGPRPVVIGRLNDSVVFIDAARAPGPITVTGEPELADRVHELLSAQLPGWAQGADEADGYPGGNGTGHQEADGSEADWPVVVTAESITLVGLPIAVVLPYEDSLRAVALMGKAALTVAHHPVVEEPPAEEPAPTVTAELKVETEPEPETAPEPEAELEVEAVPGPEAEAEPYSPRTEAVSDWLQRVKEAIAAAPETTPPTAGPGDSADEWSGFAVSSADERQRQQDLPR